jgi:uncharacterized membrane protein
MNIVVLIVQIILGLLFILAGLQHGTSSIDKLAKSSPWAAVLPRRQVHFIGLAEALGGLGVLVALARRPKLAGRLAASGLALIMLLARCSTPDAESTATSGSRSWLAHCRPPSHSAWLSSSWRK